MNDAPKIFKEEQFRLLLDDLIHKAPGIVTHEAQRVFEIWYKDQGFQTGYIDSSAIDPMDHVLPLVYPNKGPRHTHSLIYKVEKLPELEAETSCDLDHHTVVVMYEQHKSRIECPKCGLKLSNSGSKG